jgi:hypothetical protein
MVYNHHIDPVKREKLSGTSTPRCAYNWKLFNEYLMQQERLR